MGAEALCRIEKCREENNYLTTNKMASNKEIGEQWGIHPRDVEKIKFAFEVYDFKGDGKVDGFYIGDLVRACNLNPTMKTIVEIGGEKEKGKKTIVLEDMYPLFKKAKDSKDTGGIHDFVEILKLYDKNSDKTMLSKDLFRLLTNLGEKLTKEEAKGLMNECATPRMLRASPPSCLSWKGCARTTLHKQFLNETKHKRISGSRVLGRLKKSCKCCGNPDIYAIHLLPTAYPSKKISKFKREEKRNLKKTSQDLTAARRILRTHIPFV